MLKKTPVLFLIFNRSKTTQQVFDSIRAAQPQQIFIAADGPRYPLKDEYVLCEQARSIVRQIDWSCEIKTLFRDKNLGCGRSVSSAIDWFFEHVEEGIILEDDCLPGNGFFEFCSGALEKYRHDESIMMITGTNYYQGVYAQRHMHHNSKQFSIWGWSTWRRAWQHYSFSLKNWRDNCTEEEIAAFFGNAKIAKKWANNFDQIADKKLDTWDTQWVFSCIKKKALCVTPLQNLISNIDPRGTHGNGIKAWVHEMSYQGIDVAASLQNRLNEKESLDLDFDTYRKHGYFYEESKYKIYARTLIMLKNKIKRTVGGYF